MLTKCNSDWQANCHEANLTSPRPDETICPFCGQMLPFDGSFKWHYKEAPLPVSEVQDAALASGIEDRSYHTVRYGNVESISGQAVIEIRGIRLRVGAAAPRGTRK